MSDAERTHTLAIKVDALEAMLYFCLYRLEQNGLNIDDAPPALSCTPMGSESSLIRDRVTLSQWWHLAKELYERETHKKKLEAERLARIALALSKLTEVEKQLLEAHWRNAK